MELLRKNWRYMVPSAAFAGLVLACSETTQNPVAPDVPGGVQYLLTGTGPIDDDYNGRPVHGAIFTTLPFGQAVNANVQYKRKIEVYLDGGPRNPNALAAGLNDGLYVFQITDPPGKNLLSQDPARCRVVQVKGGVILGTVPASRIPGLGAATDKWADSNGEKRYCHVESSEADGASLAGQHDTNADTDLGGGQTVQMMPFLDTPNPGGVYKAWITPLAVYIEKSGAISNLNNIPKPASRAQTTGNAPDKGFANPSRNNVKTDNFKVIENPPFIRIVKKLDGVVSTSWWVSVYEPTGTGDYTSKGWLQTPATFAVPFGTAVLACERLVAGTKLDSVYVDGVKTALASSPPAPAEDEESPPNKIACVEVPGIATSRTVEVIFFNRVVVPKAKIAITPANGVNEVEDTHTFTAKAEVDPDETGFVPVADGTVISFSTTGGGTFIPSSKTCTTSGGQGECTIGLTNAAVGVDVVTATVTVLGITASTDGIAPNSSPGTKYWVDAYIAITPLTATNGITEDHTFTARFTAVPGTLPSAVNTFNSLSIAVTPPSGFSKPGDYTEETTCATPTVVSASVVTCTTKINSKKAGRYTARASGNVTIAGTLGGQSYSDVLARVTDGAFTSSANVYKNGVDAEKIYVAGSLSWLKVDGLNALLAGATFRVRRTHDRFGSAVSAPDFSVLDNNAPDVDAVGGQFKVVGLPLGKYCIKETEAPSPYLLDPNEQCGIELTITAPDGVANDFINILNGRMTGGLGKVQLDEDKYLTGGFTIHCDRLLSNNLEINWPGNKWHITKPTTYELCVGPGVAAGQPRAPFNKFIGEAIGELNGVPSLVTFVFVDNDGLPGGKINDQVTLVVYPGLLRTATPVLNVQDMPIRGNIQAHEDQPHRK